jgi:hypothetical protein
MSRIRTGHLINRKKGDSTMKRNTIPTTLAFGAAVALALSMVPTVKAAGCSEATLNGSFAYKSAGAILTPPDFAGPLAEVGTITFDGKGHLTGSGVLQQNGTTNPLTKTGTYTVNQDCTGTLTIQYSLGFTSQFFFVIDHLEMVNPLRAQGNELQILCEDSGVVVDGIARRQSAVDSLRP